MERRSDRQPKERFDTTTRVPDVHRADLEVVGGNVERSAGGELRAERPESFGRLRVLPQELEARGGMDAQIESGPKRRRVADLELSAAQGRVAVELVSGEG